MGYFYDMIPVEEFKKLQYFPTVPEFVSWIGETWADRPAVNDLVSKYTYKEFCDRIACRRTFLAELGLRKGDKVAILDANSINALELFLAVISGGYVAINFPAQLPGPAVVGSCMKFGVKVIFVREAFKDRVQGAPCKVCLTDETATSPSPVAKVDKDDPAAIFFTGGTTGTPKGALLPHRALMRGAYNGCFAPGSQLGEGHRYIGLLPLSHIFGLCRSTLSPLYTGAEWYAAEDMKATIGKIPAIRPTDLVLVPGLCEILCGLAKMYGPQFLGGQLKMIISGAANVPPRIIREFQQLGIKLLPGYGMTEAANLTTGNIDIETKPSSVGKVYEEQQVKLVDGEIWIKGDNVFLGYYGDPEKTAEVLTEDGWLKSGDLGRFDDEGFLYITGRIKNLIILSNGENVSPESIEEPFYKCDALKDCLVKEDVQENGDSCICIEILPREQAVQGKSDEEIRAFFQKIVDDVNATLPTTHRIARMIVRKEDFKRTGSLKVSRNQN